MTSQMTMHENFTFPTHLLFQHDLGGSFAVHAEASVGQFDDGAHGFSHRVEGVDFVELLLWDLVPDWLVVPLQVQNQAQQAALCFVAHLLRQTAFLIWGLERSRGKFYFQTRLHSNKVTLVFHTQVCFLSALHPEKSSISTPQLSKRVEM